MLNVSWFLFVTNAHNSGYSSSCGDGEDKRKKSSPLHVEKCHSVQLGKYLSLLWGRLLLHSAHMNDSQVLKGERWTFQQAQERGK